MSTNMNTRLQQFLSAENLTQAQFADSISVARASISHIIAGRNNPGYDFIINTMKRYPELNIEWLLTGKGKMYRNSAHETVPMPRNGTIGTNGQSEDIPEFDFGLFSGKPEEDGKSEENAAASPAQDMAQEYNKAVPDMATHGNNAPMSEMNTSDNHLQTTVKQRKAFKIIVFYDDGTFQEF